MKPAEANSNKTNLTEKEMNLYRRGLRILFTELGLEIFPFLEIVIKMNKEK